MYLILLDGNVQVSMNVFYKNVRYYFGFNIFIFIDLCLTMWFKIIDDMARLAGCPGGVREVRADLFLRQVCCEEKV